MTELRASNRYRMKRRMLGYRIMPTTFLGLTQ